MAHVLVVHSDYSVRAVMALALGEEGMHDVICTSDAVIAAAALWTAPAPVVALIDERLKPLDGWGILAAAANDEIAGPLSRHSYILMSTAPDFICGEKREVLSTLGAATLTLPFELDTLLDLVDETAGRLNAGEDLRQEETLQDVLTVCARRSA